MQTKESFRLRFSNQEELTSFAAHSELELLYLLEGTVDIQVEQKHTHMNKDDILLINPDRRRSVSYAEKPLMMHLLIDYAMVKNACQEQDVLFWCDSTGEDREKYDELRALLKKLILHHVQLENYEDSFAFLSDCYGILQLLTFQFMVKAADVQWNEEGDRFEERLFKINNYINTNYDQAISIKDLSEKLFLSIGYLSRFFKKNYGMNFASYLTNVRLVHAADELLYTNISVTRVAYDCGFTSAAIFNKAFKKVYDVTPTEFRKRAEKTDRIQDTGSDQKELAGQIEQIVLENVLDMEDDKASSKIKTAENSYSVLEQTPLRNYWGELINIGEAVNILDSSIREHLMLLRKYLGFRYVRFWGIFSSEMYIRPDQEQYDFSRIDAVLDFILEQDMKPLLELGPKPRRILHEIGKEHTLEPGEKYTNEQWQKLMTAFMRHLSARYGPSTMDGWLMELWFEENRRDDRQAWDVYLEKFRITYEVVKTYNEKIGVGGYGIRMDYGGDARIELYKHWKDVAPVPDFISIMFYGYERGVGGLDTTARRSTDDGIFLRYLKREKERLRQGGLGELPVCICEWNMTPSVRNSINDSCYKAAYIIRNLLDIYGLAEHMAYGAGSDRQYSFYDTKDQLFGGTGLISKEGILKPAAYAFHFLNRLYGQLIGLEGNYIISTDGYNNYAIVCHNQQKLNEFYYLTPETKIQKDGIWKYFDQTHQLELRISLTDVKEGNYKIKTYRINNKYGSALDIWAAMNYENNLSRNDIDHLKKVCEPSISIRNIKAENQVLNIQETLEPNEIILIRVHYEY